MLRATVLVSLLSVAPAFAQEFQGDAEAGAQQFARQCLTCHRIVDAEGNRLAGRNGRTGPNLYGAIQRGVGVLAGFRYSDAMRRSAELRPSPWLQSEFIAYLQDPSGWLRSVLGDRRARGKMAYRVLDAQAGADIFAYLQQISE